MPLSARPCCPLTAVLPKGCDSRDPRNFLLTGGARALDKDREKQQAAAAREKVKVGDSGSGRRRLVGERGGSLGLRATAGGL